ncbi:MAG: Nif3-like dinuclear metal center hexameric protein [Defluviitaleaceae bacterium]|nr:Nif3-like dinuclear metal center hexameric protein [Defluviitaleaceae bacterium]
MKNVTCEWLINELETWAPTCWAEDWDNVGLLLGDATRAVRKVLVALDATDAVVREAIAGGYDFLLTHHPLIHDPLKKITAATPQGRKILALMQTGINLYASHTNLDKAAGDVNDCLFAKIDACETHAGGIFDKITRTPLIDGICDTPGLGLVAALHTPMTLQDFIAHLKRALQLTDIRYSGDPSAMICKAGLCGGDASHPRYWGAALAQDCDVFITGDMRYHNAQDAVEAGINLIDITHYAGEALIIDAITTRLRDAATHDNINLNIHATQNNGQVLHSIYHY